MLRLYVWEDVLADYTSGLMFALAESEDEARRLILIAEPAVPDTDLMENPRVYSHPVGFVVWSGN